MIAVYKARIAIITINMGHALLCSAAILEFLCNMTPAVCACHQALHLKCGNICNRDKQTFICNKKCVYLVIDKLACHFSMIAFKVMFGNLTRVFANCTVLPFFNLIYLKWHASVSTSVPWDIIYFSGDQCNWTAYKSWALTAKSKLSNINSLTLLHD